MADFDESDEDEGMDIEVRFVLSLSLPPCKCAVTLFQITKYILMKSNMLCIL